MSKHVLNVNSTRIKVDADPAVVQVNNSYGLFGQHGANSSVRTRHEIALVHTRKIGRAALESATLKASYTYYTIMIHKRV